MARNITDYCMVALAAAGIGFLGGQYLGRQDGMRESDERHYLTREFESRYSFSGNAESDNEKLGVFMSGEIPKQPRANLLEELEEIAKAGQKPRELASR